MDIYDGPYKQSPPEDHIQTLSHANPKPKIPSQPSFGLDSLFGLIASSLTAPIYLYASLKGKFQVWDEILDAIPDALFHAPALDVGCGRGLVLLKIAQRKRSIESRLSQPPSPEESAVISPAYAIDIFSTADQTGNSPMATYKNAAAMDVIRQTILHTASFTEKFPFADDIFSLVTSNLALHNAESGGRYMAVREMARVCKPEGKIVIVDLYGNFKHYKSTLEQLGWSDIEVHLVGTRMLFGVLPCQMLSATKPPFTRREENIRAELDG